MKQQRPALALAVALVVVSLLGLSLVGCTTPKEPTIKPDSATVTSITPSGITIKLVLKVRNPNGFALKARKVKATVELGDKVELGPVNVKSGIKLPAKKTTKVTTKVKTDWANAAQLAMLAAESSAVPYVVKGKMVIGGKKLNVELPFTLKGEIARDELVKAGLKGLPKLPEGLPKIPGFP